VNSPLFVTDVGKPITLKIIIGRILIYMYRPTNPKLTPDLFFIYIKNSCIELKSKLAHCNTNCTNLPITDMITRFISDKIQELTE